MKSKSEAFFKEAKKNLKLAKTELFKPEEDIVTYSVCKNAQFAIENFLKGFLVKNNIEIGDEDTIQSLYDKCLSVDENFKTIEMSDVACKNHTIDSRYCSGIDSVSACFDTADNVDTYLRKTAII